MERNLKIFQIAVWGVIAVLLSGILIHCLIGGPHFFDFGIFNLKGGSQMETFNKTYSAEGITKINVSSGAADVIVKQSDANEIRVIKRSSNQEKDKETLSVRVENGTLNIQNPSLDGFHFFIGFNWMQTIEIDVPRSYSKAFAVSDGSGDITLSGNYQFTSADFSSGSGDLFTDSVKADGLKLITGSGDIKAGTLEAASFDIESGSGDITANNLAGAGKIEAHSGDIIANFSAITGDLSFSTGSGDIKVRVPQGLSAQVRANTGSGDINSNLPLSYAGWNKNSATGAIGSGSGPAISLQTGSGDISLNQ